MPVRRIHLFELEDQSWFPARVRDYATDYLHFIETYFELHRAIVPLIAEAIRTTRTTHIVDLCSGGSGPIPQVIDDLSAEGFRVSATLTDLFPNLEAFEHTARANERVTFERDPVNAMSVPGRLAGLRTMFNAFHHFRPADATAILHSAVAAGQPIGVFEVSSRSLRTVLTLILTPLFVFIATLFIRPFRWDRLLWTYLIPLVPLTCLWDGIVSQLRAYTPEELEALGAAADPAARWRAGRVPIGSTPGRLTYLLGYPAENRTAE
jgi:hypothetical protein